MEKIAFAFLIFILLCSCSPETQEIPEEIQNLENLEVYPADAVPANEIHLVREVTYRDTGKVFFGQIIPAVEADSSGQVYILDLMENSVHIFDPDGNYLQSIGREGRGPGEFIRAFNVRLGKNFIHILDPVQTKISVYDRQTLEQQKDIDISLKQSSIEPAWKQRTQDNSTFYQPNDFYLLPNGQYLIIFSDNGVATADNLPQRKYEISLFDSEAGSYQHELFSFDWTGQVLVHNHNNGSRIMFRVPYKRSSQFDFAEGQLAYGWTEEFLFKFYDEQGNYQRAFYYPFEKQSLNEKDALDYYESDGAKAAVRNDTLPENWPAFKSVLIDDNNRLWISTFAEDLNRSEWLVLESSGKLLARFQWPRTMELHEVKNGYAYAVERGTESGVPDILRYRIDMN